MRNDERAANLIGPCTCHRRQYVDPLPRGVPCLRCRVEEALDEAEARGRASNEQE